MGIVVNAFLLGFFVFIITLALIPYIAVFSYLLIPASILRLTYQYSLVIVIIYVIILSFLIVKYKKTRLLYLIALAPSLYIILIAPYVFALWLIS